MPLPGGRLLGYCAAAGYEEIPVCPRHVRTLETLARPVGAPARDDPFDRIMVSQAKCDGLMFVTHF